MALSDFINAVPIKVVKADGTFEDFNAEYEAVAASATDQVLGAKGAIGDYLDKIIIQPATTAAGTCTVKDGATVIFTFTTGTLGDLKPLVVPFGIKATGAGWKITTGTNVAILAMGNFT